jgi:hypothetical protein
VSRLVLSFESGAGFLHAVRREEGAPLRFRWRPAEGRDLPPDTNAGGLVSAIIRLADREADFHVHLRVTERRSEGDLRGIVFEFLPEERAREELVLACAEGESIPYLRRRRVRVPCRVAVALTTAGAASEHRGTCTEISVGGMHVDVPGSLDGLAPDATVNVDLELDGRKLRVPGRVTARIDDGPQRGVGVEFLFESAQQRDAIAERVRALEERRGSPGATDP